MGKQRTGETKAKQCVLYTYTLWVARLIMVIQFLSKIHV